MRYLLLLIFPIVSLMIATSESLILFIYSNSYILAAPILKILLFNSLIMAIFVAMGAIVIGIGKPKIFMSINIFFGILVTFLNYNLILSKGAIGSAYSYLITATILLIIMIIYFIYKFKVIINLMSLLRISFCSLIIYFLASYWHLTGVLILVSYTFFSLLYLFLLYLFGEISKNDFLFLINKFKRVKKV